MNGRTAAIALALMTVACGTDPEPVRAPGTVQLLLETEVAGEAGRPSIRGRTNLPDGVELMVSLFRPGEKNYFAQDRATVAGGRFAAGPFSARGLRLPPGRYELSTSASIAELQPAAVRELIGADWRRFAGRYIVEDGRFGRSVDKDEMITIAP